MENVLHRDRVGCVVRVGRRRVGERTASRAGVASIRRAGRHRVVYRRWRPNEKLCSAAAVNESITRQMASRFSAGKARRRWWSGGGGAQSLVHGARALSTPNSILLI